jgi:hypothetical protein
MNAVDLKDGRRKGQISLDQLLSAPPSEVMAMFRHELRQYTSNIEMWAWVLSNKELAHKHDRTIEELKQGVEKVHNEYGYLLNYLEKLQGESVDRSDDNEKAWVTLEELLCSPPGEVMSTLLFDLKRFTSKVEGWMGLLLEENFSHEEKDHFMSGLTRNVKSVRDAYDFILAYLEKLIERRQSGTANP